MKLHFIGTNCGTVPSPERHHACVILESNDRLFWFDAGEGCSTTAHALGLDLLKTTDILISHCHMDHIGGLCNLLWTIRKLRRVTDRIPAFGEIRLFIPNETTAKAIFTLLGETEEHFNCDYPQSVHAVKDGPLASRDGVHITAFHTHHLGTPEDLNWKSFAYRIEAEGKTIVYSGDLGSYSDLDPVIGTGCDALLLETGHFSIEQAHEYLSDKSYGHLYFTHNGRTFYNGYDAAIKKVETLFGDKATVCYDGLEVTV